MKNKIFKSLAAMLFAGTILTLVVQIERMNTVEAKPKGINIIKFEPSDVSFPSDDDEYDGLNDQLRKATTETEKAWIKEQMRKLNDEMEEWYESRKDLEKEKEVREKQRLLEAFIRQEKSTEEGKKKLREMLPWTTIGYDLINHSLEVTIEPEHFNEKAIKKYIKYIRNIIGDEIDLTISQMAHPIIPIDIRK